MTTLQTVEPWPTPATKMGFLFDWLLTLKCNYDCGYCGKGVNGNIAGHDNSRPHPDVDMALKMLEQGLRYVDTYMDIKKPNMRSAILNIYGGEAVYHPHIEFLLTKSSELYGQYKDKWALTRQLTTNASCGLEKWKKISEHVEYITFSWHSSGPVKLKMNFEKNLEYTNASGKSYQVLVLMYPKAWDECLYTITHFKKRGYNVRPKILDGDEGVYTNKQLNDLAQFFPEFSSEFVEKNKGKKIQREGRSCCGGKQMCIDRDYKSPVKFIERQTFRGWHCSANHFFLMADTDSQQFYTNKDCWVNESTTRGPIANISNMDVYIDKIRNKLSQDNNYFLKCVQKTCKCGMCAPKSISKESLSDVMKIYNQTLPA
jgi:hypothetical protein